MINVTAILVANIMGIVVILYTLMAASYKLKDRVAESRMLLIMLGVVLLGLIIEPLSFILDKNANLVNPSKLLNVIVIILNALVYLLNLAVLAVWNVFIVYHLTGRINKIRTIILTSLEIIGVIMLFINLFAPFIYKVNDCAYERINAGYYIFLLFDAGVIIDSIVAYFVIRVKGGMLKFFPIALFAVPFLAGFIIQHFIPGISVEFAGTALAASCTVMCLQNESIFRDRLTGLYNRAYLDLVKRMMDKSKKESKFTAMMLDLNGFKLINDNYGHLVGDEALITTGQLLREAVGSYGAVIRFAGDEFVIILNTQVDPLVKETVNNIERQFKFYNEKKEVEYTLSISVGYAKADLKNRKIDEVMAEIDDKMYKNKEKQHEEHPEWERK